MGPSSWRQLALAAAFARAAILYWLTVFPQVRRQVAHWHRHADAIPDAELRRLALQTLYDEESNLEGAAAFAAFVPRNLRPAAIRAAVAFQAIYDYVDSLVEQPATDPLANGRMLHQALDVALTPQAAHPDYYAHHAQRDDGGYLITLIDACRVALQTLPSYPAVQANARRAAGRMIEYQTLIHAPSASARDASLGAWARRGTPPELDLRWWETAAASASSLLVFALIAEAARTDLPNKDIIALETAYFPWIGALHVLLDSLIDQPDDASAGHASLVANYDSDAETADRMGMIALRARITIDRLRNSTPHILLLIAMCCSYMSSVPAGAPHVALATSRITTTLGGLARPMLLVLRIRRRLSCFRSKSPTINEGVYLAGGDR